MSPEVFLDVFQEALKVIVIIVAFIIVPSLLVGLMVAVFQAATSINEQTLSFLPRLLVTLAVIGLGGHFIVGLLMDFTIEMYNRIPQVVGYGSRYAGVDGVATATFVAADTCILNANEYGVVFRYLS